ncbi:SEC-C domain-containing protein [Desulfosudis oleivorans]|uniref:SEC-C motif domain protein n=1 Tax=Desulfosudis oleivorans (strain DSM 6200 / JCM 39069 / Hxd3) TaxID=96561 RepID=A8ZYL1_DESOH|nr:SEC-C domain-containing protein [Desulfosudis oleivorans]ABW68736.1 SEC-C motif domain protein [Desulfosudis oleivorans Hxd3]
MHPSLNAKFVEPPPLRPKELMERNEPCWCGSGKKWKICHRDRHLQPKIQIGKLLKEMYQIEKKGICLHPNASKITCSNKIIKAHTVQRAGGLSRISEKGHVISERKGFENIFKNLGQIVPELIGIGSASTFMGFCSGHDNSLFVPIEKSSFSLNHETSFLLAFRAIAYEYLSKKNAIKIVKIQRDMDKGMDFSTQVSIQNFLHVYQTGCLRGMQDLKGWKAEYDKRFIENDYTSMPHYAVEFKGTLPLVCCGGFYPEVDFDGNKLQLISRGNSKFEHVCINISACGDKSFIAFGWHGINEGPAEQFVKSFKRIKDTEKANAALMLAVEQSENTYFRPSWWNGLNDTNRTHLIDRMRSGVFDSTIRPESTYRNMIKILPDTEVANEIWNV